MGLIVSNAACKAKQWSHRRAGFANTQYLNNRHQVHEANKARAALPGIITLVIAGESLRSVQVRVSACERENYCWGMDGDNKNFGTNNIKNEPSSNAATATTTPPSSKLQQQSPSAVNSSGGSGGGGEGGKRKLLGTKFKQLNEEQLKEHTEIQNKVNAIITKLMDRRNVRISVCYLILL